MERILSNGVGEVLIEQFALKTQQMVPWIHVIMPLVYTTAFKVN